MLKYTGKSYCIHKKDYNLFWILKVILLKFLKKKFREASYLYDTGNFLNLIGKKLLKDICYKLKIMITKPQLETDYNMQEKKQSKTAGQGANKNCGIHQT